MERREEHKENNENDIQFKFVPAYMHDMRVILNNANGVQFSMIWKH